MSSSVKRASMLNRFRNYFLLGLLGGGLLSIVLLIQQNQANVTAFDGLSFLYRIFWRSILSILIIALVLIIAEQWTRQKAPPSRNSFGKIFFSGTIAALVISLLASSFQIIYTNQINPDFLTHQREQAQASLEQMGVSPQKITATLQTTFSTSQLFRDTFLYLIFMGMFVALIIAAYFYKNQQQQAIFPKPSDTPQ